MGNVFFYETKLGTLGIAETEGKLTYLYFGGEFPAQNYEEQETPLLKEAWKQLREYFEGARQSFDLPLAPVGTEYQQRVWKALQEIPYGETRSYKDIAIASGNGKASRAVGMANNRNPISIIIPCHRVIGSDGSLVGYGGGLDKKIYLLNLEKR